MLILAGVSINLTVGENGVLNRAQNAVAESKNASVLEEAQLILVDWQTDYLVENKAYSEQEAVTQNGVTVSCSGEYITATGNGMVYVAKVTEGVIGNFVDVATDPTTQAYKATHPIVPEGYETVTGTWDTGYVIKETATGDEFVWIPVMSEEEYVKKSGTKNYAFATSEKWDTDNYDVVTKHVTGDALGVTSILGTPVTDTVAKPAPEADIVNAAGGFYVSRYEIGIANAERATNATKVEKTNYEGVEIKSIQGIEPLRHVTQEAALALANNWKTGTDVQSGLITGTQWDTMCNFIGWSVTNSKCSSWGNYYDVESKAYLAGDVWHSGTEGAGQLYHWYNTAVTKTKSNTTDARIVFATGSFVNAEGGNTMKKNIYDVAGNVHEWTTETTDRDNRVLRGGSTYNYGNRTLATYRGGRNSATAAPWDIGFRAVLYVASATE